MVLVWPGSGSLQWPVGQTISGDHIGDLSPESNYVTDYSELLQYHSITAAIMSMITIGLDENKKYSRFKAFL